MVFSLFSRKQRPSSARPAQPGTGPDGDSTIGLRTASLSPREAARLTAEKIDQIESEMIDGVDALPRAANSSRIGPLAQPPVAAKPVPSEVAGVLPAASSGLAASSALSDADHGPNTSAIELGDAALPPHLEEAAILYANAQITAAVAALEPSLDLPTTPALRRFAWMMLLDLCQFAGDRMRFDSFSIEYAKRFETSPPIWNEQLAPAENSATQTATAVGAARKLPATIDAEVASAIDALIKSAARREPVADFSAVRHIDSRGAAEILRLFREIEVADARIQLKGLESLHSAATAAVQAGGENQSESSWMLALMSLRLLDRRQQFDDLSIDYCVTFEVSPPPWEPPPSCLICGPARTPVDVKAPEAESVVPSVPLRSSSAYALSGELLGHIGPELQSLKAHARDRNEVVVDCRDLRRMDFAAAGELLNEIANLKALGKNVLLVEPNHPVHALMQVMGIHELAEIRHRKG